jgi:hypothetical protein
MPEFPNTGPISVVTHVSAGDVGIVGRISFSCSS